jgi:hypothetical protein
MGTHENEHLNSPDARLILVAFFSFFVKYFCMRQDRDITGS